MKFIRFTKGEYMRYSDAYIFDDIVYHIPKASILTSWLTFMLDTPITNIRNSHTYAYEYETLDTP